MFKIGQEVTLVVGDGPPLWGKVIDDGTHSSCLMIEVPRDDERNKTAAEIYGIPGLLGRVLYVRP